MSGRTSFSVPVQVLLWAAGNSAVGAVVAVAVGVFRKGGPESPVILGSMLFGNVVGFTVLASHLVLFPRLRTRGPVAQAALLALALVAGSVAGTVLVFYLFPLYVLSDVRQAFAVTAINGVLALVVGSVVHAYEGLRWRLAESLREVEEVRLVEASLREETARAELAALQARINPHFFFNTLNTITSLLEEDPEGAEQVVQTLADLFRYTFKVADSSPVPLSEELAFIDGYLEIERARFGERLRVEWDVAGAARDARVPGLVLQPLVENAVGHGIARVPGGGTVRITARTPEGELVVEVDDDGAGLKEPVRSPTGDGHGLGNVRRRLRALYGDRASLEVLPAPGGHGTRARLRLPFAQAGEIARAVDGPARSRA